jgi:hypothetical protein
VRSVSGDWNGAVSVAEQHPDEELWGPLQTDQRENQAGIIEAVLRAEVGGALSAISGGKQRRASPEGGAEQNITGGLVCAISALEPSPTFEHRRTHIIRRERPSHVLYHYQIDPEMGWMHARIQTWFPFNIQIAINGREWLARQMDRVGLKYRQQGNCFVWIEDYEQAQKLMDQQLEVNWTERLNGFVQGLNPAHEAIFERYENEYYWTCYQSEWATDVTFREADYLKRLMGLLVRHGITSFSSQDVMHYFGKKVNQNGSIPANFSGSMQIDLKHYQEGDRVKYKLNGNSAKFYDKAYSPYGSVLRGAETTLNQVKDFRVYRPKEGGPEDDLQWRPMRKGVADLHRRAEVSAQANERLLDALASVDDSRKVEELTASIQQPTAWNDRRVRAMHPWGDDKQLLTAVNHGEFLINGFRNRDLQSLLYSSPAASPFSPPLKPVSSNSINWERLPENLAPEHDAQFFELTVTKLPPRFPLRLRVSAVRRVGWNWV